MASIEAGIGVAVAGSLKGTILEAPAGKVFKTVADLELDLVDAFLGRKIAKS